MLTPTQNRTAQKRAGISMPFSPLFPFLNNLNFVSVLDNEIDRQQEQEGLAVFCSCSHATENE
jgi:hypothetical protein